MERLDALVAGLGVLVVAVALGGVVATGPGGGAVFRVVFAEQGTPLEAQNAAFAGDGSTEVPVEVAGANITRLQFTVRITGAGPRTAPDTLEVTLDGPDGRSETQQGTLGPGGPGDATLTFERSLRQAPAEQRVRAANPDAAVAATSGLPPQLHVETHNIVVETTVFAFRGTVQPDVVPR